MDKQIEVKFNLAGAVVLSVADAALYLKVGIGRVYQMIESGELPSEEFLGGRRILAFELMRIMCQRVTRTDKRLGLSAEVT